MHWRKANLQIENQNYILQKVKEIGNKVSDYCEYIDEIDLPNI